MKQKNSLSRIRRLTVMAAVMACCTALPAQVVDSASLLIDYVPKLGNPQKINTPAAIVDTVSEDVEFNYYITPLKMDLRFDPGTVKAAKPAPETEERNYRNYIKAGFGYPVTPLAEVGMHNCRNRKYSYGLNFHHFSSWLRPVGEKQRQHAYSPSSDTRALLFFSRFFKNHTLYTAAGLNHESARLYGFRREWFPDTTRFNRYFEKDYSDSLKNNFLHVNARLGFASNFTTEDRKVKEKAEIGYDFIHTSHKETEHGLHLKSFVAYDARFLKISGFQHYRIDFNIDYFHNVWNDSVFGGTAGDMPVRRMTDGFLAEFRPAMNFSINEYHLLIGAGIPVASGNGKVKCPVYPVAELQMGLIHRLLSLYVGVDGKTEYNSLKSLLYENPYLKPQVDSLKFTCTRFSLYGGIKGNLVKKLDYHVSARYSHRQDMAFFVLDTASLLKNRFDVAYDNVRQLNVCANLTWETVDHLYLALNANYWGYYFKPRKDGTRKVEKPWYKPAWEIGLDCRYRLREQFIIAANVQAGFGRWAKKPVPIPQYSHENTARPGRMTGYGHLYETVKVKKPTLNIGFSFEHLVTRQFSWFVQVNNIGCQYASTYYAFDNFGINILAGLTYSFGNEPFKPSKKKKIS